MMPRSSLRRVLRPTSNDLPGNRRRGDQDEDRHEGTERDLRLALRSPVCRGVTQPPLFQAGYEPSTFNMEVWGFIASTTAAISSPIAESTSM